LPFTPLHLIPGLIIYLLLFPHMDLLALMLANIFIDIEPFINLFILQTRPLHGILHSLVGAPLIGAPILILSCRALETRTRALVEILKVIRWNPTPRLISVKMTLSSVYIGIASHLILDYWAHETPPVLYPLNLNNALQSEAFNLWSFDLAAYLLLPPHLILYASGLVLIPIAYIMGRRLHREKPFSHFP